MARTKPRKWIARRIAELDPERDYVEIVRLSTLYAANSLQMSWFYAVNTPAAGIAPGVMDAVWRNGTGTYNTHAQARVNDSVDHLVVWLEHGADSPATLASVDIVNKLHRHYAEEYAPGFADIDDWIYILCLNGTAVNNSIVSLGLPGFDEKQKRAAHTLWSRLADRFEHVGEGRPVTDVRAFPDSFDAMVRYVHEYEARPWPVYQPGHDSTVSAIEHFAKENFPPPLRFFGRALVTSFLSPTVLRIHSITPPNRVLRTIARQAMKSMIVFSSLLPDPEESYSDRRRRLVADGRATPSHVDTAVHRKIDRSITPQLAPEFGGVASLCPHLAAAAQENRGAA